MSSQVILGGEQTEHPTLDGNLSITCILRRRNESPAPGDNVCLSREQFVHMHAADPADMDAVLQFAAAHGLSLIGANAAARTAELSGPARLLRALFGNGIPEPLADRVVHAVGFNTQPVAKPRCWFKRHAAKQASFTPLDIAKVYHFPSATGTKQTIALIELGGGYKPFDLGSIKAVTVDVNGSSNRPTGDPSGADGEVALDIEVAAGIAPGARIVVYFAPNTEQGFYNAVSAAIHDEVHQPSIISISWGGPESSWTPQTMDALDAAFHDAALLGITVCAATGDNGSSDGAGDSANHVDFPASSPWVLACGGTRFAPVAETAWGATGGGISTHFPKPAYQSAIDIAGRGVPDVAGNADPETGYLIRVGGRERVVGGTSAVAPLWAGLIARLNERLGKNLGWLHPKLYGPLSAQHAFQDITSGNNGAYQAQTGWDACTGLGSPNGEAMLALLQN